MKGAQPVTLKSASFRALMRGKLKKPNPQLSNQYNVTNQLFLGMSMAAYEKYGESDEWYTPKYIFDALNIRFSIDVAAPINGPRYVPCDRWFHKATNALEQKWEGTVWMNPPFGHQRHKRLWLQKFFQHGNGIALLPDRTSAPWFQEFAPMADSICWLSPKVKFERPDGSLGKSPGTGTVLFSIGSKSSFALHRSGLGIITPKALAA